MKTKITALLSLGIATALIGCIGETASTNTGADANTSVQVQALVLDSSVAGQEIQVLDNKDSVLFTGRVDDRGVFVAGQEVLGKHFPLHLRMGDSSLKGEIPLDSVNADHKAHCILRKGGFEVRAFDANRPPLLPGKILAQICQLPKPDSATQAKIHAYIEAGEQVPADLLPVLTAEQKACVDSHGGPINPGVGPRVLPGLLPREIAEKCGLPKLDSATAATVRSYVEAGQIVPKEILPVLTTAQQQCIDANRPMDPMRMIAEKCNLPKPDEATQAKIQEYMSAGQQVPRELLPVLTAEQQACVDANRPAIAPR